MEKVKGLQNLAYQLGLDEGKIYCNWIQFFSSQNAKEKKNLDHTDIKLKASYEAS